MKTHTKDPPPQNPPSGSGFPRRGDTLTGVLPEGGWRSNGVLDGGGVGHAHRDGIGRGRRQRYHGGVGAGEEHVLGQTRRGAAWVF